MEKRTATCRCGQLKVTCEGEPVRISVCHCLDCQRRSGSAFAAQARWPEARIMLTGRSKAWERVADSGHKATYQFCPDCGSTIAYIIEGWPGVVAVPVGAFADPTFPAPKFSVYEHRKHPWVVVLGEAVEHSSTPSVLRNPGLVSPHHTPDDRGQAIGGLRFQAEQRRPAHETDGPRPAPHPRRATARRPLLSGIICLVPTGPAVHRAGVRTPRTHR